MLYLIIVILAVMTVYLLIRLLSVKREIKSVLGQMSGNTDDSTLSVDFVDTGLQNMVLEVNRLYERVREVKAEGRDRENAIKESVSMISHDMRTPLTSVIGYLQVARRSADPEEMRHNIDIALERGRYLNRLVNDFFELSLADAGRLTVELTKTDVCGIICEEMLSQSPAIDKRGIEPDFAQADENIYVMADRKMLGRIMQNLISNSVRYSKGLLSVSVRQEEHTEVIVRTGTAEKINTDKVFDRFYREDGSRSGSGAGLGLYICRRFAENMGGSIYAEQTDDVFAVTLVLENGT